MQWSKPFNCQLLLPTVTMIFCWIDVNDDSGDHDDGADDDNDDSDDDDDDT